MSILQDEDYIALPIPWLYEIICSDPPSHVFTAAVRSRTAASDFTPKKVRIELGRLIAAKDPLQNYFVVFLFEDTKTAEVWAKREWDSSLSKRTVLVNTATAAKEEDRVLAEKHLAISNWLEANMQLAKGSYANTKLTQTFAKLTILPKELACFPGLEELLREHGNISIT